MAYRPYQSKRNEAAQRAIGDALLELLEEKSLSEVNIKELCAQAHVSRPTFYRHFDAIDDVLGLYAHDIFSHLFDTAVSIIGHEMSGETIIAKICEGLLEYQDLFETARRQGFIAVLFGHLWVMTGELASKLPLLPAHSEAEDHVINTLVYAQGGAFSMLFFWILDGMARSPQEMGAAIMNAAQNAGGTFAQGYHEVSSLVAKAGLHNKASK